MVREPLRDAPAGEQAGAVPPTAARPARAAVWLLRSWPGRTLLGACLIKAVATIDALAVLPAFGLVDGLASVVLLAAAVVALARVFAALRRLLLWRVRRKLIVSYVFIGFVPVLLVVAFFVLAGVLMILNVSSFLVRVGFDDVVDEAVVLAETAVGEVDRGASVQAVLASKLTATAARHPSVSLAVVTALGTPPVGDSAGGVAPVAVGPWSHLEPPRDLPTWVGSSGFGGLLAFVIPETGRTELVARGVGVPAGTAPPYAIVVDLPIEGRTLERLLQSSGVSLGRTTVVSSDDETVTPAVGRRSGRAPAAAMAPVADPAGYTLDWVTFVDFTDWASGRSGQVSTAIQIRIEDIFARIYGAQSTLGSVSLGSVFLLVLFVIGNLFLIIEITAFVMGFALARSITGAVHALFTGTEKVRAGDFAHRIRVHTRDQLGQLAESFNTMTASIENLLKQAAEKKRLEEELRIARDIQMSLLPAGPIDLPGVNVTAMCVPAREVGGDYYDFFALPDGRLGILIADVSGKGTSAAFYMAELKGMVLAVSQIHHSPKQLLIEVNRLLSDHLDSRSFITMTYAVLDVGAGALTYARAGHTPLIYVPAAEGGRRAQVLAPDGLVLGLRFDGIVEKFEQLLEESTLPVAPGDVFAFYTDGVTEAMNAASDFFGESRLGEVLERHGHRSSGDLQREVLREVEAFVGGAEQHDDMTMILVKVIGPAEASDRPVTVAVALP